MDSALMIACPRVQGGSPLREVKVIRTCQISLTTRSREPREYLRSVNYESGALCACLIGCGEIFHDFRHVGVRNGRAIDLDHLGDFGSPEIGLEFWSTGLGRN